MSDDTLPTPDRVTGPKGGSADRSAEPRFLAVGRVIKPHGVQGEVRVELMTDLPQRFEWLKVIYVGERNPRPIAVESVRYHQEFVLLKLAGYPTRTEAEALRNELLQVPEEEAIPLEEGEYFLHQLLGLEVFTEGGQGLGRLTDVLAVSYTHLDVYKRQTWGRRLTGLRSIRRGWTQTARSTYRMGRSWRGSCRTGS